MTRASIAWYVACRNPLVPRPEWDASCRPLSASARGSHRGPAEGNRTVRVLSPADAPKIAASLVRSRARLPTILGVPLGRLATYPEPGSAMLSPLAVQYRGKVD